MKNAVVLIFTGVVLFGVSAAASWFLHGHNLAGEAKPGQEGTTEEAPETLGKRSRSTEMVSVAADTSQRVAVRPPYSPGAEEAVQLANTLRDRLAATKEREAQLSARQKNLELIYQDIRGERAAVDELRKQVGEELKAVKDQAAAVERRHTEMEEQRQKMSGRVKELEEHLIKIEELENGNVQKMAEMINTMAPESAAKILQQLADTSKMDTAVKLLGLMKERQAAKVLAEVPDPALAAQFLEKLKDLKRPAPASKK
jgi:flagellar motility protein MotE (MotC chaperone)